MSNFCEWCKEPLAHNFDGPALCRVCYRFITEDDKARYAQGWVAQAVVMRKRDETMPDCPCGGETFDIGYGVYRCRECAREMTPEKKQEREVHD